MTNDAWDELVRSQAQHASSDPGGYRREVLRWALLGYAVLFGALVLTLAAIIGTAAAIFTGHAPVVLAKLALPLLLFAAIVWRSLAVTLPAPAGLELRRADAPQLFATIDRLRAALRTPRIHRVVLDGSLNAAIVQTPRIGPVGPQRNHLVIGFALLHALAPAEIEGVLAHELAHIARGHGRFGAWIYRLRASWAQVTAQLDERGMIGSGLVRRACRWYVPRLLARTVALAREHEHEADHAAALVVGARQLALALVRATATEPAVARYWDTVYARMLDEPQPPRSVFAGLARALCTAPPGIAGAEAIERALALRTQTSDTHPSLSERLAALGQTPLGHAPVTIIADALTLPAHPAAATLVGRVGSGRFGERLSVDWYEHVRTDWSERHEAVGRARGDLGRLQIRAAAGALNVAAAVERATLVERLGEGGEEAALAAWRDVLALDGEQPEAHLAVGARLLAAGDPGGLEHLDRAIARSPLVAVRAAEVAFTELSGRGMHEQAAKYRTQRNRELDVLDAAAEERRGVARGDEFEPHGLAPDTIAALQRTLGRIAGVAHAYVARKRVAHLAGEAPLYVIGIERRSRSWRLEPADADARLVRQVAGELWLPGEFVAMPLAKETRWLRKRLERVDGALVR